LAKLDCEKRDEWSEADIKLYDETRAKSEKERAEKKAEEELRRKNLPKHIDGK
jgi:hypothetical protein